MVEENWKPIPGYEGYEVSDLGRVRTYKVFVPRVVGKEAYWAIGDTPKLMTIRDATNQYQVVSICNKGKKELRTVHRLVLRAFVGPCPPGMECCHLNDDRRDNRLCNLKWDTKSANQKQITSRTGSKNKKALLTEDKVLQIWQWYALGELPAHIAPRFNVDRCTVEAIIAGRNWWHVKTNVLPTYSGQ